jgi:accessory gene regulator protein AgrB
LAAKYINYSVSTLYLISVITAVFSLYTIIKRAPADTEEIPIINKKTRKTLKICGFISLVVITFITIIFVKDITYIKMIIYTIFLVNIFTIPLAYKLLNCKLGKNSEEFSRFY